MSYDGMRWLVASLCLTLCWLDPTPAQAQEPPNIDDAKALFDEGVAMSKRGRDLLAAGQKDAAQESFTSATERFLQAYRIAPHFLVLFNLGEMYGFLGQDSWSMACYQQFLQEAAASAEVQQVKGLVYTAQKRVTGLGDQPAPTGDGAPLDPVGVCYTAPEPERSTPDTVGGAGTESGTPPDGSGTPPDGSGTPPDAAEPGPSELVTPTRVPAPPSDGSGYRLGFWISGGLTLVAITGATITGWQALGPLERAKDDAIRAYQADPGRTPLNMMNACADAESRLASDPSVQPVVDACDTGKSRILMSNVLQGVAIAGVAVTGYFLYKGYLQQRPGNESRTLVVHPVLSHEGVGASMTLRF